MLPKVLIVSWLLLAGMACNRAAESKKAEAAYASSQPAPLAIRVLAAESRLVARTLEVTGSLVPDDTINVVSEVPGRVAAINYDFGQTVRKGDVLVQIDRQEYQIQVDRARAALAQALARVGLNPDQENETPASTPMIRQARAQFEDAKSKLDSARKLFESGDVARERFTEAEKLVSARQAALDAAQDDMRTSLANVQALKADKRLYEKRLADTTIRSPFDGQVSQRLAAPGQYVKDNITLMTVVKSWPLRLRADIPETGAAAVRIGETLTFTAEAIPGRTFTATVTQVNPSLESRSRSLAAEARLNQSDPLLRPGMFVQVKLTISRDAEITVVPKQAVYSIAGITKLFAVEGGTVREVRFIPGPNEGDWLEVPGGVLRPGQSVAATKLAMLSDGARVSIDTGAPSKGKGD